SLVFASKKSPPFQLRHRELTPSREWPHLGTMLELEEALGHILAIVPGPVSELIALAAAHRRILTESVLSPVDLPIFDNSAMDGYAVHAADITSAKAEAPVRLRLIGKVAAGDSFNGTIANGCRV